MNDRPKSLLIYSAKCITAVLVVFLASRFFRYNDIGWALISVILVLSPEGRDAVTVALTRIKANVVGASIGLLCLLISPMTAWNLSLALVATLSLCYLFRFDAGARSAMAATIIIMLHEEGRHFWDSALTRVVAVMAGCLLGLIITFLFHARIRKEKNTGDTANEA